jgi:hypothetical protein
MNEKNAISLVFARNAPGGKNGANEMQTRDRRYSVVWYTDSENPEALGLPPVVAVPGSMLECDVADYLSDRFGWCVNSATEI